MGATKSQYLRQPHSLRLFEWTVIRDFEKIYTQSIHKRIVRFQNLTRNLFITLHGYNVHRQQRQMSKFLMRYQQFASHAYCGAAGAACRCVFSKPCTKLTLHCTHRSGHLKTEHTESLFLLWRHLGNWPCSKHEKRTAGSA